MVGHGSGKDEAIYSVAALSGGSDRVASASTDGTVRIWRVADGCCERVLEIPCGVICSLAALPGPAGGHVVASYGGYGADTPDSETTESPNYKGESCINIWRLSDGLREVAITGCHDDSVFSTAVLPGGHQIATASEDRTLKLWRVAGGILERTFRGHDEAVCGVATLPEGGQIVSCCADGSVKVWSIGDGRCLRTLRGHSEAVYSVAVLPGGERVVTGGEEGTIRIWRLSDGACERTLEGDHGGVYAVAVV